MIILKCLYLENLKLSGFLCATGQNIVIFYNEEKEFQERLYAYSNDALVYHPINQICVLTNQGKVFYFSYLV